MRGRAGPRTSGMLAGRRLRGGGPHRHTPGGCGASPTGCARGRFAGGVRSRSSWRRFRPPWATTPGGGRSRCRRRRPPARQPPILGCDGRRGPFRRRGCPGRRLGCGGRGGVVAAGNRAVADCAASVRGCPAARSCSCSHTLKLPPGGDPREPDWAPEHCTPGEHGRWDDRDRISTIGGRARLSGSLPEH